MKKAFTLSEVLITLGVIGVVSALTISILIQNYQKHVTVNRLKETYSILYNAVRMSETENGLLESWDIPSSSYTSAVYSNGKVFFEQYIKPYIKIVKVCNHLSAECWADTYMKTDGNNEDTYFPASKNNTYGVVLANGTVIGFFPRGSFVEIYTDLNGKKGPNKFSRDAFDIIISKTTRNDYFGNFDKSGVYVYGLGKNRTTLTSGSSKGCSKSGAGFYCGALIMHDGWKIEKDYPW